MRRSLITRWGGPRSETTQLTSEVDRFLTGKSPKCLRLLPLVSYTRLCSDGALQTAHDIWENWTAGAFTRVTLSLWAFSRQGATGVPLFTAWDSLADSGRAPIPGNISGRSRPRNNTQCSRSAVGRPLGPGSDGFWDQDYGLGVRAPGTPRGGRPFGGTGTRLGTLKRIGFFCFPITLNTHRSASESSRADHGNRRAIGHGAIDVVAGSLSDATCPDRARSADLRAPDLLPRLLGYRACQPDDEMRMVRDSVNSVTLR